MFPYETITKGCDQFVSKEIRLLENWKAINSGFQSTFQSGL